MPTSSVTAGLLLLDTHAWIWTVDGDVAKIRPAVLAAIQRGGTEGNLRVSVISVWEVAMLAAKNRIHLAIDVGEWVDKKGLGAPGVQLVQLTPKIAIESTRLPGQVHADPADRILIATSRIEGMALVTRDEKILEYAEGGHVAVVDATL